MKKIEVNSLIYNGIVKLLGSAGFKGKKSESKFKRKTTYEFQEIGHPVWDYNPTFAFSFFVTIRIDEIEDILGEVFSRSAKDCSKTPTVTLQEKFFIGKNLRFEVQSEKEIETALNELNKTFETSVIPALDSYTDLALLERLLNSQLETSHSINLEVVANAGVLAAALC